MKKRIALISSVEASLVISDDQIFKDVCLVPILMKEKYDFEASIISYGINEKLLNKHFQGINCINIKKSGDYLVDIKEYLEQNAKNIDIVFLYGPYNSYDAISKIYKYINPKGKIYLKLDMNRYWLQNLADQEYFKNLLEISDLVTVEDRNLQNLINMLYNCETEYLRNGCYEFVKVPKVNYEEKKNIILSVGRLGTNQKRTETLIKAFLKADLPDWELRLVGGIEEDFLPTLEKLKQNVKFAAQVKVLGRIEDKNVLNDEYKKAKIFCMTSILESCAHVYSEAGLNGCYIVSTDVDGISDIEKYSSIVPVEDCDAITKALEDAAKNENLMRKNCYEIQEYIRNEGMWDSIISKLYLLFCTKGLMDEADTSQGCIKKAVDISNMIGEIRFLKGKLDNSNEYNNLVDLSGEVIERLQILVNIMNNNNELIVDMSIKNETTLLKEDFINYVNGIFNGNKYIIEKYKKEIYDRYKEWNEKILNSINFNVDNSLTIEEALKDIYSIFKYIDNNSVKDIMLNFSNRYNIPVNELANMPMGGYGKGRTSGAYYFTLNDMKENCKEYLWLYEKLEDEESKRVLTNLCRFRLTCAMEFINDAFDSNNAQYFDKEIIKCDENEVFVDCGGFTGDTSESYIESYCNYKKIYIYEPSPENVKECLNNISKYENIIVRQAGVGLKKSKVTFSKEGSASSAINANGETDVIEIVSLDEDIQEKITFLKMDIEGEEINALNGAKNHIIKDKPKLAVCVYHIISDLWEIPKLIYSMDSNYKLYLRHYWEDQAWETVIYAVH
ncbi:FkbM family methyltransferase [Clostridium hydrogenum]|uniref:FkbM family methyltransferase n=1 Tax=Clostridium hydrogenum TaxID=2855764 RepID=UPI001EEE79A6|nr:FkbM family methyltransferase [Clostridium hydrogenum]